MELYAVEQEELVRQKMMSVDIMRPPTGSCRWQPLPFP